ncbi:hypothetical protein BU16DRAFT_567651 [Lophium mytilinum]|uniref:RanBP2-type domain-containing protein n=1 Tax=Lophium mytilinum TaxID=390894 RepID=A0A6A6QAQ9_9PEZI|nr:hypothetical protein BU16DRAFT_567651 [Lophium mytilinum]
MRDIIPRSVDERVRASAPLKNTRDDSKGKDVKTEEGFKRVLSSASSIIRTGLKIEESLKRVPSSAKCVIRVIRTDLKIEESFERVPGSAKRIIRAIRSDRIAEKPGKPMNPALQPDAHAVLRSPDKENGIRRIFTASKPDTKIKNLIAGDITKKPDKLQSETTPIKTNSLKQKDPFARYKRLKSHFKNEKIAPTASHDDSKGIKAGFQSAPKGVSQRASLDNTTVGKGYAPSSLVKSNVRKWNRVYLLGVRRAVSLSPFKCRIRIYKYVTIHERVKVRGRVNSPSLPKPPSHARGPERAAAPNPAKILGRLRVRGQLTDGVNQSTAKRFENALSLPVAHSPAHTSRRLRLRRQWTYGGNQSIAKRFEKTLSLAVSHLPVQTPSRLRVRAHLTWSKKEAPREFFAKKLPPATPLTDLHYPFDLRPLPVDWHYGDWFCGMPNCGWHNHSSWHICHNSTCGTPREPAEPIYKLLPGEWVWHGKEDERPKENRKNMAEGG